MNDLEALVLLNMIPSLGSISLTRLLKRFSSPKKIFQETDVELSRVEGITARKISEIKKAKQSIDLNRELELARENKIDIVTMLDKNYPENLKNIYDPPAVLYVKGKLLDCDYNSVAIVGSRRASFYGLSTASRLASELCGLGITVVSGLARGIDTASHKGALTARGRTVAVLGSGLLKIYPPENKDLAKEISHSGAVISEFGLEMLPLARNFPRRNRIISGLSLGVVVVEAARNSGALITADSALQQGREVFAVPGKMDSVTSVGTHSLIKQGAKLISDTEDIIEEIAIKLRKFSDIEEVGQKQKENIERKNAIALDKDTKSVYEVLSKEPKHIDEIINLSKMKMSELSAIIMKLQLRNMIKELPGKNFVRL